MKEAGSRIIIDKLLRESGWVLPGDDGKVNVEPELGKKNSTSKFINEKSRTLELW